jgi:serine/threonine protein kinase
VSEKFFEENDLFDENSFDEKYVLLEKMGEGANGCVYRCQHKGNSNIYAVKKFVFEKEHILELKRSFLVMRELQNPSVCTYKALYIDHKIRVAYLVMEYLPYPSLAKAQIDD